jgi:hypothetical protein
MRGSEEATICHGKARGLADGVAGRIGMVKKDSHAYLMVALVAAGMAVAGVAWSELPWEELRATRVLTEGDWLALRLEVLGQRLSFPAYRVHVDLDEDRRIAFDFLASSGLAAHLTQKTERSEAEEILTYHAAGIRDQVEQLLEGDFPALFARYDAESDFYGEFLGPGDSWSDPPVPLAFWRNGRLEWKR